MSSRLWDWLYKNQSFEQNIVIPLNYPYRICRITRTILCGYLRGIKIHVLCSNYFFFVQSIPQLGLHSSPIDFIFGMCVNVFTDVRAIEFAIFIYPKDKIRKLRMMINIQLDHLTTTRRSWGHRPFKAAFGRSNCHRQEPAPIEAAGRFQRNTQT